MFRYLFRNLRHRRIRFVTRAKCDVLIVLEREAEFLAECIPERAVARICPIDREIPVILSVAYLRDLVVMLARGVRGGPALLRAVINAWDPAVVLCAETIYDLPGEVAEFYPDKKFIVLSRCLLAPPLLPARLPVFFSYGHYDKDVLDAEGISYSEHHAIGSVKAALIHRRFGHRPKTVDLCFISQHRVPIAERDLTAAPPGEELWFGELADAYNPAIALAYQFTHRFASTHGLSLSVAMSAEASDPERQDVERSYFRSFVPNDADVVFIPRTSTSSYEAVLSSRVSVTVDSTLGLEALGLGERVFLFVEAPTMRKYYEKVFRTTNPPYYSRLPKDLKMTSDVFSECELKMKRLLELPESDYQELVKDARAYYMNNAATVPADEFLRSSIEALV